MPAAGRRVTIGGLFGALAVAAVLAAQSGGFVARHGQVGSELDAAVAAYLASRPSYVAGDAPVAIAPFSLGLLGGDRLRHHVTLIAERAPCADVLARARRGWLVIIGIPAVPIPGYPGQVLVPAGMAAGCMAGRTPRFTSGSYRIFGPAS